MKAAWATKAPIDGAAALGRLRARSSILALENDGHVWLSGAHYDDDLDRALRAVPDAERFLVLADSQLLPINARVPNGRLPSGDWMPLTQWLTIRLAPPALAGELQERIAIAIVRSSVERDANLLRATWDAWHRYGVEAPQVRLDRWAFAVNEQEDALIRGAPPPPIAGRRYVENQGVAVPVGWTWSPALDVEVVRELLQLRDDDLALFSTDGSWRRIAGDAFVNATRSAIRLTGQSLTHA